MSEFPKFVKMRQNKNLVCCLRLAEVNNDRATYLRDSGRWFLYAKYDKFKTLKSTKCNYYKTISNKKLYETTEMDYFEDNQGSLK